MGNVFAVWENWESMGIGDACLVSILAILIVFAVLTFIILITTGIQKGMDSIEAKTNILPKECNKVLDEDPDAVAALMAATIDFQKEFGKNPEVISITRED